MGNYHLKFLPGDIEVSVPEGYTIIQAAAEAGVELEGPCGGKGTCGKCTVSILRDSDKQTVLACKTPVSSDLIIEVPQTEVSLHRKSNLTETPIKIDLAPGVRKVCLELTPPDLEDPLSDAARLARAMGIEDLELGVNVLRELPRVVGNKACEVTVLCDDKNVLWVEPGNRENRLYGLALDIGTTTVVGSLVDLHTGETMAAAAATNSQNVFGADVISRINHVMNNPLGLESLNRRVIGVINRIIAKLAQTSGVSGQEICLATVVGNTTMSHLFLSLDPTRLAYSPFIPVTAQQVRTTAKELGLNILATAPVMVLPNVAGYVGADTVGVILSTDIEQCQGVSLVIDIGTNGEIVLAHNGKMHTCSTAAGPAFEGAQITFGMRAADGAIEQVKITEDVNLKVIGDVPAKGICGSGLMDAVAELLRVGIINHGGRIISQGEAGFLPVDLRNRLGSNSEGNYFVLATEEQAQKTPVLLTQKDVRELQLAKAAVSAGIEILLEAEGLSVSDIDRVLLAGAFGSYIDRSSALAIGLLPPVDINKIKAVGNAAGHGAKLALLSTKIREQAVKTAKVINHIELSVHRGFQDKFINALGFGGQL